MRGFLTLLVYAELFYLMMRFGCGAHMVHGHSAHGGQESSAKDPVCGMSVGPGQGYIKNHEGRELHFCSRNCLDKFEAAPLRYLFNRGE